MYKCHVSLQKVGFGFKNACAKTHKGCLRIYALITIKQGFKLCQEKPKYAAHKLHTNYTQQRCCISHSVTHLLASQRVETLSNFGERSLSELPPDQIVPDPFGVVKVLEDVRCGTA